MSTTVAVSAAKVVVGSPTEATPKGLARGLRRADDLTRLAVAAAAAALAAAPRAVPPEAIGLFVGMAFGPIETNFRYLDTLFDEGEGQSSPTLFSHSVHNTVAGYVARLFDFQGPSLTVTSFAWPFLSALEEARWAVASGRVERAMVIAAEVNCPVLEEASERLQGTAVRWQPGAVAWLLDPVTAASAGAPAITAIEITETPCHPDHLLTRSGERWSGVSRPMTEGQPLGYALALTDAVGKMKDGLGESVRWDLSAPFGQASLEVVPCRRAEQLNR